MATIVLAAAGAAIGSGFGGAVLGLSGMLIGRAVGATVGRMIDQRLMGGGSQILEGGRIERLRLTGASDGTPVAQVWGRVRLGGQVIWASDFVEDLRVSGGVGAARSPDNPHCANTAIRCRWRWRCAKAPFWGSGASGRTGRK